MARNRYNNKVQKKYYNQKKYNPNKMGSICPNALISVYLRSFIVEWKEVSLAECNYRCVITGSKDNLEIHHFCRRYHKLIEEAHINLGIENKIMTAHYQLTELALLKEELLRLHFKYGLGVVIDGDLHEQYHKEYHNNINAETFKEFYKKIKNISA